MTSFTIDSSVLALPEENTDFQTEYKNLQRHITNMFYLQKAEKNPSVTISYMKNITEYIKREKLYSYKLRERIHKITNSENTDKKNITYYSPTLHRFIFNTLTKITNKEEERKKGKIGIYENLLDRDEKHPNIKYRNISYKESMYPANSINNNKPLQYLSKIFKLYLGFVAYLNNKYSSGEENFLVISGDTPKVQEKVTFLYDNFNESKVNIIGIQNIDNYLNKIKYTDITKAFNEVKKENISFGQETSIDKISKNMDFTKLTLNDKDENSVVSELDFASVMNLYINELNNAAVFALNKEFNNHDIEKELVFYLNAHGCLCSPDSPVYINCPAKTRHFGNKNNFSLHLKPITYNLKHIRDLTCRIYFKWLEEDKKILIGHIGEHPQSCSNDPDSICVQINCKYRPQN